MSQTTIVVAALLLGFHPFVFAFVVVVVAPVFVVVVVVVNDVVSILLVFLFFFSVVVLSVVVFVEVWTAEYNFENNRLPMFLFLFLVEELFLFDGDFSNEYDEKISSGKKFQKSFKTKHWILSTRKIITVSDKLWSYFINNKLLCLFLDQL